MQVSVVEQSKPARLRTGQKCLLGVGETGSKCCCCGALSRQPLEIELSKLALKAFSVWLLHDLYQTGLHVVEPIAGAVPWMVMMLAR